MILPLLSLSVLIPDAQTIPLSLQNKSRYMSKDTQSLPQHVTLTSVALQEMSPEDLATEVIGRSAYSVVIDFDVPLHPGALLPNWSQTLPCGPSNCGLSDSYVISKAGFPRIFFFFVLPRRIHFETALPDSSQQEGMH